MTATLQRVNHMWFTGKQIAAAITFHLKDEGWFETIPKQVAKWLKTELPESKRISFKEEEWKASQTGTRRMLWLMTSSGLDPFFLCKFAGDARATQIIHRRFNDILDTWSGKD